MNVFLAYYRLPLWHPLRDAIAAGERMSLPQRDLETLRFSSVFFRFFLLFSSHIIYHLLAFNRKTVCLAGPTASPRLHSYSVISSTTRTCIGLGHYSITKCYRTQCHQTRPSQAPSSSVGARFDFSYALPPRLCVSAPLRVRGQAQRSGPSRHPLH